MKYKNAFRLAALTLALTTPALANQTYNIETVKRIQGP